MTQPENFSAAQAVDPTTPGQVLADIAALRPDLRAAVASNPSAYPGLIEWLQSLGEPAVDAAIAARSAAGQPTQLMPVMPPMAPQGVQTPPAPQWAGQQPAFAGQQPAYPGMPPAGMPPQGGPQYGAPPVQSSNKALWIILIVLGALVLLGVGAFLIINALGDDDTPPDVPTVNPTTNTDVGGKYGDNAELDALWDSCEAEDWEACDELYRSAPGGSEYEAFGDTCGNRQEASTGLNCVSVFGDGPVVTDDPTSSGSYGDDASLDALWDACEAEDWEACDSLYWQSPVGSEYESFGDTCGERSSGEGACVDEFGGGTEPTVDANTYGDDPALDALWDACEAGDGQACDDLYWESPYGSEYETFGSTCAGRVPEGVSSCVGQ